VRITKRSFDELQGNKSLIRKKQLLQFCQLSFLCLALVLSTVLVFQPAFTIAAQQTYESAPVLSASKILPPELLSGPHHRVEEAVNNNGYFNIYRIDSKFGVFTAVSTAMLRKRIGEINAMVAMEKIQGTTEYLDSIKEGGLDAMQSAMSLVTSPVQTLSGAAQGIGAASKRSTKASLVLRAASPRIRASKTPSASQQQNGSMPMSSTSMFTRTTRNFRTC
jgi:hypothetical protein